MHGSWASWKTLCQMAGREFSLNVFYGFAGGLLVGMFYVFIDSDSLECPTLSAFTGGNQMCS